MATVMKIGPADRGRPMTLDEFLAGDYEEGYRYELIDGGLYVSPEPNLPEDWVKEWVLYKLKQFAQDNPKVLKHATGGARVFVPGHPRITCPEPDIAAYRRFPLRKRIRDLRWQDVSPILVVEVLSADDPKKDLIRNVALYREVPSIKEYWILDGRKDADYPRMTVYRRRGQAWQKPIEAGPGERYTTPLLPGFELVLDTRS
jgi:Uma2 family endonuclease